MTTLSEMQAKVLKVVKIDDAYWTSDIASMARMRTSSAGSVLKILAGKGLVERVVTGNPTSWRLTDAGLRRKEAAR